VANEQLVSFVNFNGIDVVFVFLTERIQLGYGRGKRITTGCNWE
jgi:hypothetical protein